MKTRTLPCKHCDKEVVITVNWEPKEAVCSKCSQLCGICHERKAEREIRNGFIAIEICDSDKCADDFANIL